MKVLRVSVRDVIPLRAQMLRPGKPLAESHFQGDTDEQTFHLGAFVDNKLVSVASFYFDRWAFCFWLCKAGPDKLLEFKKPET